MSQITKRDSTSHALQIDSLEHVRTGIILVHAHP